MIDKREIKRFGLKIGKFLDPLGLFLLIALFILPTLAVINLSPKSKVVNNVLGAKSQKEISVVMVGGVHDFLKEERIEIPSDDTYIYHAQMIKHDAGTYSKPILQIINTYEKDIEVTVSGGSVNPTGSPFSIIFDEKQYMIQDEKGEQNTIKIQIPKQSKKIMYIQFDTTTPIKFNEDIEVMVVQ